MCEGLSDSSVKISHNSRHAKDRRIGRNECTLRSEGEDHPARKHPRLLTGHIETCYRSQIHELIEFRIEVRIGLGLLLTFFNFIPCDATRSSADYEALLLINCVAERHHWILICCRDCALT